eukprot:TRINITY_DN20904_c0_g1_i2.p1 TRINITY_DN20904_c0_g1~~TRINITY_DN20904_c0_g1_i2.p1  ORF type:complete len:171 (-),score=22.22 TRINITY_DN20904_c0_g1_i2:23-535(-)
MILSSFTRVKQDFDWENRSESVKQDSLDVFEVKRRQDQKPFLVKSRKITLQHSNPEKLISMLSSTLNGDLTSITIPSDLILPVKVVCFGKVSSLQGKNDSLTSTAEILTFHENTGVTLLDEFKKRGRLSEDDLLSLAKFLVKFLEFINEKEITHGAVSYTHLTLPTIYSV